MPALSARPGAREAGPAYWAGASFLVVQASDGNYLVTEQIPETVFRTRTKEVQVGDKKVLVPETYEEVLLKPVKRAIKGSSIKVYDADGNLVPPADAAARLKDETLVVMSADGKMVDPAFRALLSRKVLILVGTEQSTVPVGEPRLLPPPPKPEKVPVPK